MAVEDEENKYSLPQDVIDVFDEYSAALKARDEVMKSFFKMQYKKAVYYGRIAEQSRRKFWKMVREIFPELHDCTLTYDEDNGIVLEKKHAK